MQIQIHRGFIIEYIFKKIVLISFGVLLHIDLRNTIVLLTFSGHTIDGRLSPTHESPENHVQALCLPRSR